MNFWVYVLGNSSLDIYLKSLVSEDPLISDMVNRSKHGSKLNDSTFGMFIDPCYNIAVVKRFS